MRAAAPVRPGSSPLRSAKRARQPGDEPAAPSPVGTVPRVGEMPVGDHRFRDLAGIAQRHQVVNDGPGKTAGQSRGDLRADQRVVMVAAQAPVSSRPDKLLGDRRVRRFIVVNDPLKLVAGGGMAQPPVDRPQRRTEHAKCVDGDAQRRAAHHPEVLDVAGLDQPPPLGPVVVEGDAIEVVGRLLAGPVTTARNAAVQVAGHQVSPGRIQPGAGTHHVGVVGAQRLRHAASPAATPGGLERQRGE